MNKTTATTTTTATTAMEIANNNDSNNDEYEKFKTLLNDTMNHEKELKELRVGNPKENALAISNLLNTIRSNYHQLILQYPHYCSSLSKVKILYIYIYI